jgi:hypothetical protein
VWSYADQSEPYMQSYPPTFLDALIEATNFLDRASQDESMTKADICASMETRLSLLVGKMVAAPTGASFAVFTHGPPDKGVESAK